MPSASRPPGGPDPARHLWTHIGDGSGLDRHGSIPTPRAPRTQVAGESRDLKGIELSVSARTGRPERMVLLPPIDLLEDRLPDEVSEPIEVIVRVDDAHEIVVVAAFNPPGDGDLGQHFLSGLGEGGCLHHCNVSVRKSL